MKKDFTWKIIITAVVIIGALIFAYDRKEKKINIQLGLDLKGGMHLVLQVVTDDAINYETDQAVLRLRERLKRDNIEYGTIAKTTIGKFSLQEFNPEQEGQIRRNPGRLFQGLGLFYNRQHRILFLKTKYCPLLQGPVSQPSSGNNPKPS